MHLLSILSSDILLGINSILEGYAFLYGERGCVGMKFSGGC